jgi:chromosome segregation ATPase
MEPAGDNAISQEEFEKLENKEGKKKKQAKPKKEGSAARKSDASELDQLTIQIEKLSGRLDVMDDLRKDLEGNISRLSEEIGELRSSLLEKERGFNKIETGFTALKDMTEQIEPGKLYKELGKKDEEIVKLSTRIELLETKEKELKDMLLEIRDVIKKIKNMDYLLKLSDEIKEQMADIENNKKITDRIAGKVEEVFAELQREVKEFTDSKQKIELNEATIQDILRDFDKLELKIQNDVPKKKDVDSALQEIKEKLSRTEAEYGSGLSQLKDIMDRFLAKMEEVGADKLIKELDPHYVKRLLTKDDVSTLATKRELDELRSMIENRPALASQQAEFVTPIPKAPPKAEETKDVVAEPVEPRPIEEEPEPGSLEADERKLEKQLRRLDQIRALSQQVEREERYEQRPRAAAPAQSGYAKPSEEAREPASQKAPMDDDEPHEKNRTEPIYSSTGQLNDLKGNISGTRKKLEVLLEKGY